MIYIDPPGSTHLIWRSSRRKDRAPHLYNKYYMQWSCTKSISGKPHPGQLRNGCSQLRLHPIRTFRHTSGHLQLSPIVKAIQWLNVWACIYVTLFVVTNVGGESGKLRAQLKICILPSDILGWFSFRVVDRRLSRPPTGIKASSLRMTCLIKLTPMICFIGFRNPNINTSAQTNHKSQTQESPNWQLKS